MKTCTKCQQINSTNKSWCKSCTSEYLKNYRNLNKEKIKQLNRNWRKSNKEEYKRKKYDYYCSVTGRLVDLNKSAKRRAKNKNIEFDLNIDFLKDLWESQKGNCSITGLKFIIKNERTGKAQPFSPSIDRIDPNIGYTKSNVRLVCYCVNCFLHDFGENILEKISKSYILNETINCEIIEVEKDMTTKQLVSKKYRESTGGTVTALFHQCKKHAKEKGYEFSITKQSIKELILNKNNCEVTKISFDYKFYGKFSSNPFRPSIDRIDSKKGYIENNIRLVCVSVNFAINEFGEEVLKEICSAYLSKTRTI